MTGSNLSFNFTDKRRTGSNGRSNAHLTSRKKLFTSTGTGTTTTMVGANPVTSAATNIIRLGDKFRLKTSAGVTKEETVFTVTAAQPDNPIAGTTTVTFTPAAATAPVNTDVAYLITMDDLMDETNLDAALNAINGTSYTTARLQTMNTNDKLYAYRVEVDKDGI